MIARFAGAILGLLAFTITAVAGVWVQNPVTVTLSRSILALVAFCVIGVVLGTAAQVVVREHEKQRKSEILQRYREGPPETDGRGPESESIPDESASRGARGGVPVRFAGVPGGPARSGTVSRNRDA